MVGGGYDDDAFDEDALDPEAFQLEEGGGTKEYTKTHTRLGPGGVAAASLNQPGTMEASGSISFSRAAALVATGTLAALGTLSFDDSADLRAAGNMVAVGSLAFAGTAESNATGGMVATSVIEIETNNADLDAIGTLESSGAIAFSSDADIEPTADDMSATGSQSWAASADLNAIGEMVGAGSLAFTPDATLGTPLEISASADIGFEGNADLNASGSLVAAGAISWSSDADLTTPDLEATGTISFTGSANLSQATGSVTLGVPEWPVSIRNFRIDLNENKTISESLFTRQRQVMSLSGGTADRWEGLIVTPMLSPANVRVMMNFLVEVGLYGRFTIRHPDYTGPSSGVTTALVDGAGQTGTTLAVNGLDPSTTIAEEGDWFQVGDEFKRLTEDAITNSSGEVTLAFKPAIRLSPMNNDSVEFESPLLLAELTTIPGEETDALRMMSFTISFQEAFVSA